MNEVWCWNNLFGLLLNSKCRPLFVAGCIAEVLFRAQMATGPVYTMTGTCSISRSMVSRSVRGGVSRMHLQGETLARPQIRAAEVVRQARCGGRIQCSFIACLMFVRALSMLAQYVRGWS